MLPVLRRPGRSNNNFDEPFTRFRKEVDTLFDRFFGSDGGSLTQSWAGGSVAMCEDDDHIFIEADVPGVDEKDIEVTVHNGMLCNRGERHPEPNRSYLFNGRSDGRFERVIALKTTLGADDVKAKLSSGVLAIELSKTPASKPKKITVQTV